MINLSNTNLVSLEVPENSFDFEHVTNQAVIPYKSAIQYYIINEKNGYIDSCFIDIGFDFSIVGTIKNNYETDFDFSEYARYSEKERVYHNFFAKSLDDAWDCDTKEKSLISLLKSNNVKIKENKKLLIIKKI